MQSSKTQRAERVTFHVVQFGDGESRQAYAVEREAASKRQIVPCAVAPGATVTIEGRKRESGEEIRIVEPDELKNMSLSDRQRSATPGEIDLAKKMRAVILVNERELVINRRRRLTPGAPFTHKIVRMKSGLRGTMSTNAGPLEVGCYVGPDDFHQAAVPEVVEPEQRRRIKLEELTPHCEPGWFVEAVKPERVTPGKPALEGAERLRELEAAGRVAPIEDWEWKFAEAEHARLAKAG